MTAINLYYHPDYNGSKEPWTMYRDLYNGQHDALTQGKYLWYHYTEKATNTQAKIIRALRAERSRYLNIPEILISLWTSYFFRKDPVLDEQTRKLFDKDFSNVDGKGNSFIAVLKEQILKDLLLYGHTYALVDSYRTEAVTRAEESARGARPYLEILEPLEVVDWEVESADSKRIGKYNFLRNEFKHIEPRSFLQEPVVSDRSTVRLIEDDKYHVRYFRSILAEKTRTQTTQEGAWEEFQGEVIVPELSEIPLSYIHSESWLKDAMEETLRHFNLRSNKDNILHQQGYQKGFIIGVDPKDNAAVAALSEYNWSLLPENGNAIAIEPVDVSSYERAESEALGSAFKVGLNQLRALPTDSREAPGADSQDAERENTHALVESTIEQLETMANDIIQHWARFKGAIKGDSEFPGRITFDRSHTKESFDRFVRAYTAFADTFNRIDSVKKTAAQEALKEFGLPPEKEAELAADIESASLEEEPEEDIIGNALNGR